MSTEQSAPEHGADGLRASLVRLQQDYNPTDNVSALMHTMNELDLIRARSIGVPRIDHRETQLRAMARESTRLMRQNESCLNENDELQRRNSDTDSRIVNLQQKIRNFARIHDLNISSASFEACIADLLFEFRKTLQNGIEQPREAVVTTPVVQITQRCEQCASLQERIRQLERTLQATTVERDTQAVEAQHLENELADLSAKYYKLVEQVELRSVELSAEETKNEKLRLSAQETAGELASRIPEEHDFKVEQASRQVSGKWQPNTGFETDLTSDVRQLRAQNELANAQIESLSEKLVAAQRECELLAREATEFKSSEESMQRVKALATRRADVLQKRVQELEFKIKDANETETVATHQVAELRAKLLETCSSLELVQEEKLNLEVHIAALLHTEMQSEEQSDSEHGKLIEQYIEQVRTLQHTVAELNSSRQMEHQLLLQLQKQVNTPKSDAQTQCSTISVDGAHFDAFVCRIDQISRSLLKNVTEENSREANIMRVFAATRLRCQEFEHVHESFKGVVAMAADSCAQRARQLKSSILELRRAFLLGSAQYRESIERLERLLSFECPNVCVATETAQVREITKCVVMQNVEDEETTQNVFECVEQLFAIFLPNSTVVQRKVVELEAQEREELLDAVESIILLNKQAEMRIKYLEAVNSKLQLHNSKLNNTERLMVEACDKLGCKFDTFAITIDSLKHQFNAKTVELNDTRREYADFASCVANIKTELTGILQSIELVRSSDLTGADFVSGVIEPILGAVEESTVESSLQIDDLREQLVLSDSRAAALDERAVAAEKRVHEVLTMWRKAIQPRSKGNVCTDAESLFNVTSRLINARPACMHEELRNKDDIEGIDAEARGVQTDALALVASAVETRISACDLCFDVPLQNIEARHAEVISLISGQDAELLALQGYVSDAAAHLEAITRLNDDFRALSVTSQARLDEYAQFVHGLADLCGIGILPSLRVETVQTAIRDAFCATQADFMRVRTEKQALALRVTRLERQIRNPDTRESGQQCEEPQDSRLALETIESLELQTQQLSMQLQNQRIVEDAWREVATREFDEFAQTVGIRLRSIEKGISHSETDFAQANALVGDLNRADKQMTELYSRIFEYARQLSQEDSVEQEIALVQSAVKQKNAKISEYANIVDQTAQILAEIVENQGQDVYQSVVMLNRDYQRILEALRE